MLWYCYFRFKCFPLTDLFRLNNSNSSSIFRQTIVIILINDRVLSLVCRVRAFRRLTRRNVSVIRVERSAVLSMALLRLLK